VIPLGAARSWRVLNEYNESILVAYPMIGIPEIRLKRLHPRQAHQLARSSSTEAADTISVNSYQIAAPPGSNCSSGNGRKPISNDGTGVAHAFGFRTFKIGGSSVPLGWLPWPSLTRASDAWGYALQLDRFLFSGLSKTRTRRMRRAGRDGPAARGLRKAGRRSPFFCYASHGNPGHSVLSCVTHVGRCLIFAAGH
jgi:hypothetical protein